MSAETRDRLSDALAAHVADETPDQPLLTDFYLIAASVGGDAHLTNYLHVSSDTATHVLMGLVNIGNRRLNACYETDGE